MPSKKPQAPPSRSKRARTSKPSAKARSNDTTTRPSHNNRAKSVPQVASSDVDDVDEQDDAQTPAARKKPTPALILAEYVINAKTMVGVQSVHRESKATVEGLWSYRRYNEVSALKVAEAAKARGVEPVLKHSIAVVYSKSMKPAEYFNVEVHEPDDWRDVESLVNALAKSLSKGIRVDFTMEYHARAVKYVDEGEDGSDSSEGDGPATVKRPRKVYS
jgi:hypothetical protein